MSEYVLGIDNGLTVSKAGVFDLEGKELSVASRKTETITPKPGWSERDMEAVWKGTAEAIKEAVVKSGVRPEDIVCAAPTGHGNGLYPINEQGRPVCNAITANDQRARQYIDRWLAEGVYEKVLPLTMQSLWPGQPNALLAWLRDNQPETFKKIRWVLMCKDYIRYRLTGEVYAELTDMSGTSLMNVGTGQYDAKVLGAFGIEEVEPLLPPIKQTADICGHVTAEAADQTGLREGMPVAGGNFDIDSCGLASGMVNAKQLCMVAGTWGNNQYISKKPVVSKDVFMTSRYSIPGYYLMLEGSATSASNLEWFVTEFFGAEKERAEKQGTSVYELCNELAGAVKPEDSSVVFLPFLYGSNAGPDAKSCLVGLTGWHNRGHVIRAIYEGVVFGHKTHVEKLLQFRDMPEKICFTGGAARSEVWVQIYADVFGVPVEIPAGTELGALGAAICAAVAADCYDSYEQAVRAMVKVARVQQPNPDMKEVYAQKYKRYKKVISALEPVWQELR